MKHVLRKRSLGAPDVLLWADDIKYGLGKEIMLGI